MPRLLIAASGTGGHIYPALALAESLPMDWDVEWLGVPNRLEIELVPKKYNLTTLGVEGLQGNILKKMFNLFKLLFSSIEVYLLLRQKQIDVIFTTGGYISAPSILAAKFSGIPVLLHESNAIPGKVTKLLGRFCDHIALGIPIASSYLFGCKTSFTGTPVRSDFFFRQSLPSWVPIGKEPLIVIMGGSQGAKRLNDMVRNLLPWLLDKGCRVVHLTGKNDYLSNSQSKVKRNKNLIIRKFSNEIPGLFQHADLVISRSGAGAISELMVTRTPSILVPFPQATDNHQEYNAAYMAKYGGAIIVHQHNPEEKILHSILSNLLDSDYLKKMKTNMNNFKSICSEEKLFQIINSFI